MAKQNHSVKHEPTRRQDAIRPDSVGPSPRGSPTPRGALPDPDPRAWSVEEDEALLQLVRSRGATDWATKAAEFPYNRSTSAIRKRWFKLQEDAADDMANARRNSQQEQQQKQYPPPQSLRLAAQQQNRSFDQFADPPEVGKPKSTNKAPPGWTKEEDAELRQLVEKHGVGNWGPIETEFSTGRSSDAVRKRWHYVLADSDDDTAPSTAAKQPTAASAAAIPASKWAIEEDLELVRLVQEHGATSGKWDPMAEQFSSKFSAARSGGSLRGRWQRLEDEAAAVGSTAMDMRINLWNKTEKVIIKGENAPRRQDLAKRLSEHPEIEVYTGQNGQQQLKPSIDSLGRSSWTTEEDGELTKLVEKHGVGNWQALGAEFTTSRSSDSLRHRWTKLEKYAASASSDGGGGGGDGAPPASYDAAGSGAGSAPALKTEESPRRELSVDTTRAISQTGAPGGGWAKGTPDSLGRTLWTVEEDAELTQLVEKHGAGNWDPIEDDFTTNRTADALRKRWVKLQAPMRSPKMAESSSSSSSEVDRLGLGLQTGNEVSQSGRVRKAVVYYNPSSGRSAAGGGGDTSPTAAAAAGAASSDGAAGDVSRSGRMRKAVETFVPGGHTVAEAKHRDSRVDAGDERVVMWNTITQRKSAGNSAPRRAHLQQYLQDHPEYEVYTGQNLPGGGMLKSPGSMRSPGAVSRSPLTSASSSSKSPRERSLAAPSSGGAVDDDARTVWGALEDAELARLVREGGAGSWVAKASVFSTGRSASAIRMRWSKLEEDAEAAGTTAGEIRIRVWSRTTQRVMAGNSAPRRENLERFLEEHP